MDFGIFTRLMVALRKRWWKKGKRSRCSIFDGSLTITKRKQHILIGLSYRSDGCIFLWHHSQSSKTIFYPTEDWVLRTLIPQWSTTVSKQLSPSSSTANRAALRCGCNSLFGGARPESLLSSLFSSSLSFFPNPPPRAFPSSAKKKLPFELIRELNHCVFGAAIRSVWGEEALCVSKTKRATRHEGSYNDNSRDGELRAKEKRGVWNRRDVGDSRALLIDGYEPWDAHPWVRHRNRFRYRVFNRRYH